MSEYMDLYIEEMKEHLGGLNQSLLLLEKAPGDREIVNSIFRSAHTMKGSSGAMGFVKMETLTHGMEDILQDVRDGKIHANRKIIELLFICHDFLENSLESIIHDGNEKNVHSDQLLARLHEIIGERHGKLQESREGAKPDPVVSLKATLSEEDLNGLQKLWEPGEEVYEVSVTLAPDCLLKSVRTWMILQMLSEVSKIFRSIPAVPRKEDFESGQFSFDGLSVHAILVTKEPGEAMIRKLNSISEIGNVCVEPWEIGEAESTHALKLVTAKGKVCLTDLNTEDPSALVDAIIGEEDDDLIEINSVLLQDILTEILGQTEKAEGYLQSLKGEPQNPAVFNLLYRTFHTLTGLAGFLENKLLRDLASVVEQLLEYRRENLSPDIPEVLAHSAAAINYIRELCTDKGKVRNEGQTAAMEDYVHQVQKICTRLETVPAPPGFPGEESGQKEAAETAASSEEDRTRPRNVPAGESGYMRIPTSKVDHLVDTLGELLIYHSLLEEEVPDEADDKYRSHLMRMAKIIKDVQTLSMSLRMVSLKTTLQKILRIGRDTAVELGKDVEISAAGEDTEIDRSLSERILDPLMHLVRNSISHGIESPEVRTGRGKPARGQVRIIAGNKRGSVYIEVSDDGNGLDLQKIFHKAKEKNLIDPAHDYTDDEIAKFIFLPGFSTQERVDTISGRGVGMNVVETEISKMGGRVDVENRPGQGCTFLLKIPINLAVMNGTIVHIGGNRYIIPTLYIKQFIKPQEPQWVYVRGKKTMLRVRDEILKLINLDAILRLPPGSPGKEGMALVLEMEQQLKVLPVNAVIGRQEIVAKPLGREFGGLGFVSGASILGDGKVSMILDVEALFKLDKEY